jgi:hypothetical protein
MTFYQFLKDNDVDISIFIKNCTPPYNDPEGDFDEEVMHSHRELFTKVPANEWLERAFIWREALPQPKPVSWSSLNNAWHDLLGSPKPHHGFPSPLLSSRKG